MNDDKTIETYPTSDLALAATLLCLGFDCNILPDKTNPNRATFIFISNDTLKEGVSQYWKGEAKVEPKGFSNAQRELKTRIREGGVL